MKKVLHFVLTLFLLIKTDVHAQDAFMGYNYSTATYPLAWSTSLTTFNASTNKEVTFLAAGGGINNATVCNTSNISNYQLNGNTAYIEISLTTNSSASSIGSFIVTGSSNSTSTNTAKAGVVFSSSTTFSLTSNILGVAESDFFPASTGAWTPLTITPPPGTKSLRIYRRIFYNSTTGVAQTGTGTGFVQFGLGVTLRVASAAVDISTTTNAPATQASNIVFSNTNFNSFTASFTNGDGARRVVFMKEGSQGTITNPTDGTVYTASNSWTTKGTQLGTSGYYCVYNGTGSSVNLLDLDPTTTYWLQVFEFNGTGGGTKYLTTTATNNPRSETTTAAPVAYFYQSKQTGNWSDASSWSQSTDGNTWVDAVGTPSSTDNAVNILATHEITVSSGTVTVDELNVANGAKLIVSNGATLTIANGAGTDLVVNGTLELSGSFASAASSTITINGTFENKVNSASFSAGSGSMTIAAGGTYRINGYTANAVLTFTNVSFTSGIGAAGATLYIASGAPRIPAAQNGNVVWNTPTSGNSIFNSASNSITGNFTIIATTGINNGAGGSGRSVTVGGDMFMQGGTYHVSGAGATVLNSMIVNGNLYVSGGTLFASATTASGGSGLISVLGNIEYTGGSLGGLSTVTSGTIQLAGTTPQTVDLSSTNPLTIANFTLNNASGATLSGSTTLDAFRLVTISAGTLNTGGKLVLKSTASGTARIAAGTGSYISGNVTTETYIPAGRRAFRFLSHPFTAAQAMSNLVDDIFVTGAGAGFDATATNEPSSFWFNDASNAWTAFTSTADASWAQHRGARVLVRGDRTQAATLTGGTDLPNAVTLDVTGAVNTGDQNISLSNAGNFHFVGNPYPSPTDIGTVIDATSDIGTTYWVWDANAVTRGAYVPVTKGSGAYNLAMNGAFFVQPTASTTLAFTESNKVATATANLFRTQATPNQLELQVNYNGTYADKLFVRSDNTATAAKQLSEDGTKLMNPDVNLFTLATGNEALTLDARPIASTTVIPMGFTSSLQSSFEIALNSNTLNNGLPIVLKDKYLNVEHVLTANSPYNFAVTADAASQGNDRFELVFRTSAALPTTFVHVAAQQKGAAIEVTFTTANESNMHNYEVEESKDGTSFTKGTTLEAKNAATNTYNWLDVNVHNGNNYYRVKAIEKNGAVKYSQIVRVNVGKQTADFTVYPNPVKGGIVNLQLTDIDKGVYTVKIYNNIGQEIAGKQINHNGGSANQTISIGNVPTGKYNMVITNGTTSVTKTVIVE